MALEEALCVCVYVSPMGGHSVMPQAPGCQNLLECVVHTSYTDMMLS